MDEYRVIKEEMLVGDPLNEGSPFPTYDGRDIIKFTRYVVQVKGFIFWHTVKAFKKILPAARLLHHLRALKDE